MREARVQRGNRRKLTAPLVLVSYLHLSLNRYTRLFPMISFSNTRRTSSVPSRFAADTAKTGVGAVRARSAFNVRAVCGKSVFVATMNPGRLESPGKYSSNSRLRISNASQGLTPSPLDKSTTYANASHRSTCRKKLCPNPLFSCAPLIKPGMSASVIVSPSVADTAPSCGCIVVNA